MATDPRPPQSAAKQTSAKVMADAAARERRAAAPPDHALPPEHAGHRNEPALFAGQDAVMAAATQTHRLLLDNIARVNEELMSFMQTRLQRDVEISQRLVDCKTAGDLIAAESEFMRTAIGDYFEEAARLVDLTTQATRSNIAAFEARRGTDKSASSKSND